MDTNLPPKLQMFARIHDAQSPAIRELFQYALTMLMVEEGKAEDIERHVIDLREHLADEQNLLRVSFFASSASCNCETTLRIGTIND